MNNVYIHDNVFSENELKLIESKCFLMGDEFIPTDNCNEHVYETKHYEESEFINTIRDKGLLPNQLSYTAVTFRIRQAIGGEIKPHYDDHYYFVMSLYLNNCIGGDLHIVDKITNEEYSISPKRNRLVIMTTGNLHWTTPVEKDERLSIQMFVNKVS